MAILSACSGCCKANGLYPHVQGTLTSTEADFMSMLDERGITAGSSWKDVQAELLRDPRFQAISAADRLVLFGSYVQTRTAIDALKVPENEKLFMVCCILPSAGCSAWHANHGLGRALPQVWAV
jgi:hypothetical protein